MNLFFIHLLILIGINGIENPDNLRLELVDEFVLKDAKGEVFQTPFSKFLIHKETLFFSSDNPVSISGYDLETGNQTLFREIEGQGPFEVTVPWELHVNDQEIFALDQTGKLVIFNLDGEPIDEYQINVLHPRGLGAVSDKIVLGSTFPENDNYLMSLNRTTNDVKQFGPDQSFGNTMMAGIIEAGPLLVDNKMIYAIPPHGNTLNKIDVNSLKTSSTHELNIRGFEFTNLKESPETYINDTQERRAFINGNSVITGWYKSEMGWNYFGMIIVVN